MRKEVIGDAVLYCGDCLDVAAELEAASIDALVSDPPYGLEFMGKNWDRGVPGVHFWQAFFRIVKPGAHLLAFGGTRTFHRQVVAIEDAGWQIRDLIGWIYSQGFPKNLNIGCKCTTNAIPYHHDSNMRDMRETIQQTTKPCFEDSGSILQQEMQRGPQGPGLGETRAQGICSEENIHQNVWGEKSCMEGRCNILEEARKLQANQVCSLPDGIYDNGEKRRLCNGASFNHGDDDRTTTLSPGGCPPYQPRPTGQQPGKSGIVSRQQNAQDRGSEAEARCSICGGLKNWQGWGTALKPAWEPICLARKPLVGTVAGNVMRFGTGAINVDACRIPGEKPQVTQGINTSASSFNVAKERRISGDTMEGRWPANILHDGSDEVVALFPADDGESAARFFYAAKASREDRDEGLDGMRIASAGEITGGRVEGSAGLNNPRAGAGRNGGGRNIHPTVKPTDLMRWCIRLVAPAGSVVFDPFMGSGSTGKAAMLEGRRFVGAELSPEYFDIACRRIEAAYKAAKAQPTLFDELEATRGKAADILQPSLL